MLGHLGMISHKFTMIPGFGRTGFGRDEIYPYIYIYYNLELQLLIYQPKNKVKSRTATSDIYHQIYQPPDISDSSS
jgi:hypothetical protein